MVRIPLRFIVRYRVFACLVFLFLLPSCTRLENPFPDVEPSKTPVLIRRALIFASPTPTATPTPVVPAKGGTSIPLLEETLSPENAGRITLLAERGRGSARGLAISTKGDILAVTSTRGVSIYDSRTLDLERIINTNATPSSLAFSEDGDLLACGFASGLVQVFEISNTNLLVELYGAEGDILSLAFSNDRSMLSAGTANFKVHIWRVPTGQSQDIYSGHNYPVRAMVFSQDNKKLYSWGPKDVMKVWGLSGGKSKNEFYTGKDDTGRVPANGMFSGDGKLFAANFGKRIRIFQTSNGYTLSLILVDGEPLKKVTISNDGALIAGLSQSRLTVWEVKSGKIYSEIDLPTGESPIRQIVFQSDGERLIALSDRLMVWNTGSGGNEYQSRRREYTSSVTLATGITQVNNQLITLEWDGGLRSYDLSDGAPLNYLPLEEKQISCATFSSDASWLAAGLRRGGINLWHTGTDNRSIFIGVGDQVVTSLSFSLKMDMLAGATQDSIIVWRLPGGSVIQTIPSIEPVQEVVFASNGDRIVSRTAGEISVWEVDSGKRIASYPGYAVAYAAEGDILAVASVNNTEWMVDIRQVGNGEIISKFSAKGYTFAFTPDARLLVVGGSDVTLWNTKQGVPQANVNDPGFYGRISFSPDGTLLIQSGGDGTVHLWGVP